MSRALQGTRGPYVQDLTRVSQPEIWQNATAFNLDPDLSEPQSHNGQTQTATSTFGTKVQGATLKGSHPEDLNLRLCKFSSFQEFYAFFEDFSDHPTTLSNLGPPLNPFDLLPQTLPFESLRGIMGKCKQQSGMKTTKRLTINDSWNRNGCFSDIRRNYHLSCTGWTRIENFQLKTRVQNDYFYANLRKTAINDSTLCTCTSFSKFLASI